MCDFPNFNKLNNMMHYNYYTFQSGRYSQYSPGENLGFGIETLLDKDFIYVWWSDLNSLARSYLTHSVSPCIWSHWLQANGTQLVSFYSRIALLLILIYMDDFFWWVTFHPQRLCGAAHRNCTKFAVGTAHKKSERVHRT